MTVADFSAYRAQRLLRAQLAEALEDLAGETAKTRKIAALAHAMGVDIAPELSAALCKLDGFLEDHAALIEAPLYPESI